MTVSPEAASRSTLTETAPRFTGITVHRDEARMKPGCMRTRHNLLGESGAIPADLQ